MLSPEDLATLVTTRASAAIQPGYRLQNGAVGTGQGLAAAFAISDICQALAGDTSCIFDPSGWSGHS